MMLKASKAKRHCIKTSNPWQQAAAASGALGGVRDGAVQGRVVRPAQPGDAGALHAAVLLVGLSAHGEELEQLVQVRAALLAPVGHPLLAQPARQHRLRPRGPSLD